MVHTCAATYSYIVKVCLFLYRFKGKLGGASAAEHVLPSTVCVAKAQWSSVCTGENPTKLECCRSAIFLQCRALRRCSVYSPIHLY